MGGVHRGPGGDSYARSAAVLAGLVIGPLAVIAGLIWFFANATDLELAVAALIPATAGLVKGLVQGKLDIVWVSASTVVVFGWEVVRDVTHQPGGGLADFLVRTVAVVCLGIAFVMMTKDGRVWKAIRARLAPGPGGGGPASPG